jgi:protein ImuB
MERTKILQRIACIWLPNWPLQRLTAQTELNGRVVLLYEARSNGGLKIVACSRSAASAGVRIDMPLAEAVALVEGNCRFPIVIELHDPIADRQSLEGLALWCQQFSPIISLEDAPRPESLLLDLTGIGQLFGGETALLNRIRHAFAERHLTVRVTLADTIGAAWALAHYPGDGNLQSLPIAALRLPAEIIAYLEELGIDRIEQLVQLPRETLLSRFGSELLLRLDQATGILPEAIIAHKPPPEFEVEWLLEYATDRQEMIDFVLEMLVTRLAEQLAARCEGIVRLECRFDLQSEKPLCFSVGLYRASAAPKHLLGLIQLQLEKTRLRAAISAIRLTALAIGPLAIEQQGLFTEDRDRASPRHLATFVDRLASRLGREAVLQPKLLSDAQPEYACQYLPLAGWGRESISRKKTSYQRRRLRETDSRPLGASLPLRPLQLVAPVPLQVMAIVPEGPPIRFRAAGSEQRVVNVWGPERIETGWWRKRGVRRDYYRVETHTGQRFWLFRRLSDERWFCHGVFE